MVSRQDEEVAVEQYRLAEELLERAGYRHYELSSWARTGFESRHNGAYWARRPYTGIGAGAHSYDGMTRSWNERDLDTYLARVESGTRPTSGSEELDRATHAFEAVALGLRRVSGVSRAAYAAEFGEDLLDSQRAAIDETAGAGLIEVAGDWIRLTARGRLLANEALVAFAPSR
jgi:coproporphyrinogen III oxidase-like Fe-S oxidoreductase